MYIYHYPLNAERHTTMSVIMLINIFVSTAEFWVVHQYRSCSAGENEIQLLSGEEKTALQVVIFQSTIQINSSLPIISGYLQSSKTKPARSKRSHSTQYLILETYCYIFSPIKLIPSLYRNFYWSLPFHSLH